MINEAYQPTNKLLNLREVAEIVTLSRSHVRRLVKQGRFPPPIHISQRRIAWEQADIQNYIDSRKEQKIGAIN